MPRYMVERTYPQGLALPDMEEGGRACQAITRNNALEGVTWLHSYVTPDNHKSFCLYAAPMPEAVRRAARRNGLPVDRITEVRFLDSLLRVPGVELEV